MNEVLLNRPAGRQVLYIELEQRVVTNHSCIPPTKELDVQPLVCRMTGLYNPAQDQLFPASDLVLGHQPCYCLLTFEKQKAAALTNGPEISE